MLMFFIAFFGGVIFTSLTLGNPLALVCAAIIGFVFGAVLMMLGMIIYETNGK